MPRTPTPQTSTSAPSPDRGYRSTTTTSREEAEGLRSPEMPKKRVWRPPIREENSEESEGDDGEDDYEECDEAVLFYERFDEEPMRRVES